MCNFTYLLIYNWWRPLWYESASNLNHLDATAISKLRLENGAQKIGVQIGEINTLKRGARVSFQARALGIVSKDAPGKGLQDATIHLSMRQQLLSALTIMCLKSAFIM